MLSIAGSVKTFSTTQVRAMLTECAMLGLKGIAVDLHQHPNVHLWARRAFHTAADLERLSTAVLPAPPRTFAPKQSGRIVERSQNSVDSSVRYGRPAKSSVTQAAI